MSTSGKAETLAQGQCETTRTGIHAISTLADARTSNRAALTITEVARVLELDPRTVSAAATAGDIPCVRLGRRVLIPRSAFLALFDASGSSK